MHGCGWVGMAHVQASVFVREMCCFFLMCTSEEDIDFLKSYAK